MEAPRSTRDADGEHDAQKFAGRDCRSAGVTSLFKIAGNDCLGAEENTSLSSLLMENEESAQDEARGSSRVIPL